MKPEKISWLDVWQSLDIKEDPEDILKKLEEGKRGVMPRREQHEYTKCI